MMPDFKGKQKCFSWSSWADKKLVFLRLSGIPMEFLTMDLKTKPSKVLQNELEEQK